MSETKPWRCGCIPGQPPVCRQHRTEASRVALNRNKRRQARRGMSGLLLGQKMAQVLKGARR